MIYITYITNKTFISSYQVIFWCLHIHIYIHTYKVQNNGRTSDMSDKFRTMSVENLFVVKLRKFENS